MSFKLVLGRAGSGKTTLCREEMSALVRHEPRGVPLLLLVPEQATLQMEKALVWDDGLGGMMRIQVLSFQRLVGRLFSDVRGGCRVRIGEVGRLMMLTRILLDHRRELRCYAPMASSPGLVENVSHMMTELRTYRVFPHDLADAAARMEGDRMGSEREESEKSGAVLADKLHDLALVYRCYNEATLGLVHDWDYEMEEAFILLPEADFLRGAHIWVDGFKGFTPQEMMMLSGLLRVCGDMTVTLPLDPELAVRGSSLDGSLFSANVRIFESVLETYKELGDMVLAAGIRPDPPVFLSSVMRTKPPALAYLERSFAGYPVIPFQPGVSDGEIEIHVHPDVRREIVAVVRRICVLARDHGYHWRDMAVMTRGMEEYRQVLEQEFDRHGVPFFLDDKHRMLGHALLTLVRALLGLAGRRWQMTDVFDALRTGFFPLSRDEVDRLENLCLAAGAQAEDWERGCLWFDHGQNDDQQDDKVLRTFRRVSAWLRPLVMALRESEPLGTVGVWNGVLSEFLQQMDVPGCLDEWAEECEGAGELAKAQVHRQIWRHMVVLIEQMNALLGEGCLSLTEYAHVLQAGLRSIQLGVVPPRSDEVIVGAMNRTRLPEVKVVFVVGCVQGLLPPEPKDARGLFDAGERAVLRRAGVNLDAKGKREYNEELFFLYTVLAAPTEKLVFSYPLSLGGGAAAPSFLVTHVREMFPGLVNMRFAAEEVLSHPLALTEEYVARRDGVFGRNTVFESWLLQRSASAQVLKRVLEQAEGMDRKRRERVPRSLTRLLYGQPFSASVSRLKAHALCPFASFVQYGLKGRERQMYRLSAPEAGVFSHAMLNEYARMLFRSGENWHDVAPEEVRRRLDTIMRELVKHPDFAGLVREARHRFMLERQQAVLAFSVDVLSGQAREGDFATIGVEMSFGDKGTLPALRVPLEMGDELVVSGRIDRIDAVSKDDVHYIRVVDYKARSHPAQAVLAEMTGGLDLQLLLYLEMALRGGLLLDRVAGGRSPRVNNRRSDLEPGAMAFFALTEPVVACAPSVSQGEIDERRRKKVRMEGFVCDVPEVAAAFGERKLIKSDGSLTAKSCLSRERFSDLRRLLWSHLRRQGDEIMSGFVEASPARMAKVDGCRYCRYHCICGFDPTLPGCRPRLIKEDMAWMEQERDAE